LKRLRPFLFPLLLLPLAAAALTASLPAQDDAAAPDPLVVVAVGDSTTGFRVTAEQVWSTRLQEQLDERHIRAWVVNAADSTGTTRRALQSFADSVLVHEPSVVVIQLGLNDAAVDVTQGRTVPRIPREEYLDNLRGMAALAREAGALPVFVTPSPAFWTDRTRALYGKPPYDLSDRWGLNHWLADYAQGLRDLAAELRVPLLDVFAYYKGYDAIPGRAAEDLLTDGVHPTDDGHAALASRLAEILNQEIDAGRLHARSLRKARYAGEPQALLDGRDANEVYFPEREWDAGRGQRLGGGAGNEMYLARAVGEGDFRLRTEMALEEISGSGAAVQLGDSYFGLDGKNQRLYLNGPMFGTRLQQMRPAADLLKALRPFEVEIERVGASLRIFLNDRFVQATNYPGRIERIGFVPMKNRMAVGVVEMQGALETLVKPQPRAYTLPVVDLAEQTGRQVVVDREAGQYLGHPTTVLLEDGRTILCAYPKGHGKGGIILKRSRDGGRTWSERLPVPASWATSEEVPTLHRVVDAEGRKRLILFSGLYPVRMAVSEDDGVSWSDLEPVGDYGGIVCMASVERLHDGRYMALFHDDGRFLRGSGERSRFCVYKVLSADGGLTWSEPTGIATDAEADLCEPGLVRSPDGKTIAVLLRENSRRRNSFVIFSADEGETWSAPRELPAALTGDRHVGRYAPDGRLFFTFRDTARKSATQGDWVGWVGTWQDLVAGREGQYRVRLMDNQHEWDCAYAGLELLPDGTFVATTYGHWVKDAEPFVVSVSFTLGELDALLE